MPLCRGRLLTCGRKPLNSAARRNQRLVVCRFGCPMLFSFRRQLAWLFHCPSPTEAHSVNWHGCGRTCPWCAGRHQSAFHSYSGAAFSIVVLHLLTPEYNVAAVPRAVTHLRTETAANSAARRNQRLVVCRFGCPMLFSFRRQLAWLFHCPSPTEAHSVNWHGCGRTCPWCAGRHQSAFHSYSGAAFSIVVLHLLTPEYNVWFTCGRDALEQKLELATY